MIRLSRITDYGIVLMAHLAGHDEGTLHNAREVASDTQLPLPVVSKILKSLARECTMHPGACAQESSCHVREPWQRINQAVRDALDGITLADLAAPSPGVGPGSILSLESLGVDTRDLDTRATS
jgi:DNA-binding IscR family transcriptional regulator